MATGSLQEWRLEGSVAAELPIGPSDREVIATLERVARAEARLNHALASVDHARARTAKARAASDRAVDAAHADVVWAQAEVLSSPRSRRAAKNLKMAILRERAALRQHGFEEYADYDADRTGPEPVDPAVALARSEQAAAQEAWLAVQAAFAPTVIIDLTGNEARVIG